MCKVWRGFGFLVVPVVAALYFGAQFATAHFAGGNYWNRQHWPAAAALAVAAVICFVLGRRMNKPASRSQGENRRTWTHDLLCLRMEWWAAPVLALAVAAFVFGPRLGAPKSVKAAAEKAKDVVTR
jgi:hypothetical protein